MLLRFSQSSYTLHSYIFSILLYPSFLHILHLFIPSILISSILLYPIFFHILQSSYMLHFILPYPPSSYTLHSSISFHPPIPFILPYSSILPYPLFFHILPSSYTLHSSISSILPYPTILLYPLFSHVLYHHLPSILPSSYILKSLLPCLFVCLNILNLYCACRCFSKRKKRENLRFKKTVKN